jgi:hypothetical protein
MSVQPIELNGDILLSLGSVSGAVQIPGGGWAEAGKVYKAPDGDRFFYTTAAGDVVYVLMEASALKPWQKGKVFVQGGFYFAQDITLGGMAAEVVRITASTKVVMQTWLDLYMGCMACMGGPAGWAVKGFQAAVTLGGVVKDFDVYKKGVEALLYNESRFKQKTPVLYKKVLENLLLGKIAQHITGRVQEKVLSKSLGKVAGPLVGVYVSKMGEDPFKLRLKAVNALFVEVLIKVAEHMYANPGAKLSKEQVEGLGKHVRKQLECVACPLSNADSETIVQEVAGGHVRTAMKEISAALSKIA